MDICDRLSITYPVVQAAMGGGISGPELVCAVSKAGGLGSLGHTSAKSYRDNIQFIKNEPGVGSYSANLLLPLATSEHIKTCIKEKVPIVSLFYGYKKGLIALLKQAGCIVAYQVGSLAEAEKVFADGADIVIVQGYEAGGHIRGTAPLHNLLPIIKERFPDKGIIAAGGVHNGTTASAATSLGADAIAAGTRFLMSEESAAHSLYKRTLVDGNTTVVTSLFGFGWHAPHRVLQNSATEKWLPPDGTPPGWIHPINKGAAVFSKYMPDSLQNFFYKSQSKRMPIYTPMAPNKTMNFVSSIDYSALYAGACVSEINTILPAADIVTEIGRAIS